MLTKVRVILTALVLLLPLVIGGIPVSAQGGGAISYGETISGEITNAAFEVPFTFTGAADDIVVIRMVPVELYGDLDEPSVILLDSNNGVVGSVDRFGDVTFATVLPADGEYTILATRANGRAGDAVGEFKLTLLNPQVLNTGDSVSGTITSEETNFYAVRGLPRFTVNYELTGGDFHPELTVNLIDRNSLDEQAVLFGAQMVAGSVTIVADPTLGDVYIIKLAEALFDFNFNTVSADYTLTVTTD
jgi:hypothetical protein